MSRKRIIKRMSRNLFEKGIPPDAPGIGRVLERIGARSRTLIRALFRLDRKRLAKTPGARPRFRLSTRGMMFNIKSGRFVAHPGWRAITW